jgi:hypothetical protein
MAGMSLAGARSFEDFQRRKDLRDELLAIEIANEAENERRVKDYRNPYMPKAIPPQYKSVAEQKKDIMRLEREALKILLDIGVDYEEAVATVSWIRQDTDRLTKFVAYASSMKREIMKKANPMFIESKYLINIIRPVLANADLGLGFSSNGTQYNSISKLFDDYDIQATLEAIKEKLNDIAYPKDKETGLRLQIDGHFRSRVSSLNTTIGYLITNYPNEEQFNTIRSYELPVQVGLADELNLLNRKYQIPSVNNLNEILHKLTKYEQDDDDLELEKYFTVLDRRFTFDKGLADAVLKLKASIGEGLAKSNAVRREKFDTTAINAISRPEDTANEQTDEARINAGLPSLGDEEQATATIAQRELTQIKSQNVRNILEYAQKYNVLDVNELIDVSNRDYSYILTPPEVEELERGLARFKDPAPKPAPKPPKPAKPAKPAGELRTVDVENIYRRITQLDDDDISLAVFMVDEYISGERDVPKYTELVQSAEVGDAYGTPKVQIFLSELDGGSDEATKRNYVELQGFLKEYIEGKNAVPLGAVAREINTVRNTAEGVQHFKDFVEELDTRKIDEQKFLLKNLIAVARSEMPKSKFPTGNMIREYFADYDDVGKSQLLDILNTYYTSKVKDAELEDKEYKSKSFGVKKMDKSQIAKPLRYGLGMVKPPKVGKGVEAPRSEPYKTFGKYLIHIPSLEENVANFKYPSRATIPHIKRKQISNDYTDFLKDLMISSKMNEKDFNRLCDAEKEHFSTVTKGAGLSEMFKVKPPKQNKKDLERYELLIGEFKAGNNSPVMLKELRALIIKFMDEGKIKRKDGQSLLVDLSV